MVISLNTAHSPNKGARSPASWPDGLADTSASMLIPWSWDWRITTRRSRDREKPCAPKRVAQRAPRPAGAQPIHSADLRTPVRADRMRAHRQGV